MNKNSVSPIGALVIVPVVILLFVILIALKAASIWEWLVRCCRWPQGTFHCPMFFRSFASQHSSTDYIFGDSWGDLESARSGGSSFVSRVSSGSTFIGIPSEVHPTSSLCPLTQGSMKPRSSLPLSELSNVARPLPVVLRAPDLEPQTSGECLNSHLTTTVKEAPQWQRIDL